jgi:ATP diphosphatase
MSDPTASNSAEGKGPAAPQEPPRHACGIDRLVAVMAALRDPERGCPWDLEQDFASIAPYTIEEAYEVAEAIRNADLHELRDELGDLLLQVVYHSRMAEERAAFDFDAVAAQVADKMIRRHPHVFADSAVDSADAQTAHWERQKEAERAAKATAEGRNPSALDGLALGLPALMRAAKLQKRAARVGFDWPEAQEVFAKLDEELAELRHEVDSGGGDARTRDELGDLLFTVANLARKLDIDPEAALRDTNAKFERRFRAIERALAARGQRAEDCSLETLEALWQQAKRETG